MSEKTNGLSSFPVAAKGDAKPIGFIRVSGAPVYRVRKVGFHYLQGLRREVQKLRFYMVAGATVEGVRRPMGLDNLHWPRRGNAKLRGSP